MGGGGKLYRNSSKRLSPTTAGGFINDSSTTSSSPERQPTVNIVNDLHRQLTATILHSSLKDDHLPSTSSTIVIVNLPRQLFLRHYETTTYRQRQLRSTTFSSFHRLVIYRRTTDLQKRQRSSTVYDDLSDKQEYRFKRTERRYRGTAVISMV